MTAFPYPYSWRMIVPEEPTEENVSALLSRLSVHTEASDIMIMSDVVHHLITKYGFEWVDYPAWKTRHWPFWSDTTDTAK
jgi:hypothetical protein